MGNKEGSVYHLAHTNIFNREISRESQEWMSHESAHSLSPVHELITKMETPMEYQWVDTDKSEYNSFLVWLIVSKANKQLQFTN